MLMTSKVYKLQFHKNKNKWKMTEIPQVDNNTVGE